MTSNETLAKAGEYFETFLSRGIAYSHSLNTTSSQICGNTVSHITKMPWVSADHITSKLLQPVKQGIEAQICFFTVMNGTSSMEVLLPVMQLPFNYTHQTLLQPATAMSNERRVIQEGNNQSLEQSEQLPLPSTIRLVPLQNEHSQCEEKLTLMLEDCQIYDTLTICGPLLQDGFL